MPRKSEETLSGWTGRASDAEDTRYEWTKKEIREAVTGGRLDEYRFDVYAKGSYPNHTNVVRDSDVDIAVELTSIVQHEFIHSAKGKGLADVGASPYTGSYNVPTFKDDVEVALIAKFGRTAVERGNKAIHVREDRRRLKADVVVCQTLKSHASLYSTRDGIQIEPDRGGIIHNFPKQHLLEGVAKNDRTLRRYKRTVRILKRLENEMVATGVISAVPSFLIESLVWNVSDSAFVFTASWTDRAKETLRQIYHATTGPEPADEPRLMEANNVKFLFHSSQSWTRAQANAFALAAWTYLGFAD